MARTTKPTERKTPSRKPTTRRTAASRPPRPRFPAAVTAAIAAAQDRKASDVVVLNLRRSSAFTDFFILCTGQNVRQVAAIADAVEQALKALKLRPAHVEGYDRAEWVLMDYFDFIVHVFTPSTRAFYSLDRLWGTAERIEIPDPGASPAPSHP
jgi:ribosome-associated protein